MKGGREGGKGANLSEISLILHSWKDLMSCQLSSYSTPSPQYEETEISVRSELARYDAGTSSRSAFNSGVSASYLYNERSYGTKNQ